MKIDKPKPAWKALRTCARPGCNRQYTPSRLKQRYCREYCRNRHWREEHPRMWLPVRRLSDGSVQITFKDPEAPRVGRGAA